MDERKAMKGLFDDIMSTDLIPFDEYKKQMEKAPKPKAGEPSMKRIRAFLALLESAGDIRWSELKPMLADWNDVIDIDATVFENEMLWNKDDSVDVIHTIGGGLIATDESGEWMFRLGGGEEWS